VGQATWMSYDLLGRMTARYEGDQSGGMQSHWIFDTATTGVGQLAEAFTGQPTYKDYRRLQSYDSQGRPSLVKQYLRDGQYTAAPDYDTWGRVISQTYRRGSDAPKVFNLHFNNYGYLAHIDRGTQVLWTVTRQDAANRVIGAGLGNGLTQSRSFNAYTGRLDHGEVLTAANVARLQEGYLYDVLGNVTTRTQYWDAGGFQETFHYDTLNRLSDSQVVGGALLNYTYDAAGNILTKDGVGTYSYPQQGPNAYQPHAVQSVTSIPGTYVYDKNGNLKSGGGRTVTWNGFDMPLTVKKGTTASATFYYGPEHQRVVQTRDDGDVIYAGAQEVEPAAGGGVRIKTYWPNGLGVEIDQGGTTQLNWTHVDRLGSPIAMTAEEGTIRADGKLEYDAWGKRRSAVDNASTDDSIDGKVDNRGFTGHEMLDQLDLVHMNGRVYDPLIGKFMSGDPLIQDPQNGQNYNRYSYVVNNPTNMTDPTGFSMTMMGGGEWTPLGSMLSYGDREFFGKAAVFASLMPEIADNGAASTPTSQKPNSGAGIAATSEEVKSAITNGTGPAGNDKKPKEGDHDYAVWTKLKEKCDADCIKDWQKGSKLFSYPSEGLKPSPADLSGKPQVVYGTLPFQDAGDPSNYTTPGGRVVQSEGPNGTLTNTTLQDHVFCCGTISRTLMITKDNTLYMYTHGVGYNVYMGTDVRSDALAKFNSYAGEKIFRALDQQLIKHMNEEKK